MGKPRLHSTFLQDALKHILWRSSSTSMSRKVLKKGTVHPRLCAKSKYYAILFIPKHRANLRESLLGNCVCIAPSAYSRYSNSCISAVVRVMRPRHTVHPEYNRAAYPCTFGSARIINLRKEDWIYSYINEVNFTEFRKRGNFFALQTIKQGTERNSTMGKTMLQMTQIRKIYRTELVETHALRELSLSVNQGEFVALTGSSGSGKTTFLNIAGMLESFDSGTYLLDGEDVSHLDDDERSIYRNQKIGFIFQSFNLIPDLNLFENIDVPLRYRRLPKAERKQRIEHALEMVGLASRMKHIPSQLSGGQQQRVAIARAIAGKPKLLLADEPTGNLDTGMARQVMGLLEEIHTAGTTIVMVTHDPELAARAERNIQLLDGRVLDAELAGSNENISQAQRLNGSELLSAQI